MKYPSFCPRIDTKLLGFDVWIHQHYYIYGLAHLKTRVDSMPRHQEALPGNLLWRIPGTCPMWTRRKPLTKAGAKGVAPIPTWQTSLTICLWPILVFFFYVVLLWWIFVVCEKSLIATTKGGSWIFWGEMAWICCSSVLGIWQSTPVIFPTLYSGLSALCVLRPWWIRW